MKLIKIVFIVIIVIAIVKTYPWIITAGGVGNISIYRLSCNISLFDNKIDSIISYNSHLFIPINPNYNLSGTGYEKTHKNIALIDKNSTYVFRYKYVTFRKNWETDSSISIALTSVGKYNEALRINKELYPFEDCIWENRFERILELCDIKYSKK